MEERINTVLMQVFDLGENEIEGDLTREQVGKWDSLTHMDLVVSLEKEFGVTFELDDIIAMVSLNSVREVIKRKEPA